jgi:tetratricopeptide (TPR) repeat protein
VQDNIVASIWVNKGHIDKAIKLFEKAVYLYPAFSEAFYNLGNTQNEKSAVLALNGNFEDAFVTINKAIQNHKKSIKLSPTFPEPYNGIGNALVRRANIFMNFDNYEKALISLNKAVKFYKKALKEYPNFPKARDDLDNLMAKTYNNMGIAFVGKAYVLIKYRDFEGALENLDEAIKFYNKSIDLYPGFTKSILARKSALKRKKSLMYKMNKKLSRALPD